MLKKCNSTLRYRLLMTVLLLATCYAIGILSIRHWHTIAVSETLQQEVHDRQVFLKKLLDLQGNALDAFSYDYTFWDDMVSFANDPDSVWGAENILESLPTYNANASWVLNRSLEPVYYASTFTDRTLSFPNEFRMIVERTPNFRFAHFFVRIDTSLFEIRGASIHPTADNSRVTDPQGYFFVGRLWGKKQLDEISKLTGGEAKLLPVADAPQNRSGLYDSQGMVSLFSDLPDWNKKTIAVLSVQTYVAGIREHLRTTDRVHLLSALLTLGVLGIVSWLLIYWVTIPLRQIKESLDHETIDPVERLLTHESEFGQIARSIERFLLQKAELVKEIEQRLKAEHDLLFTQFSVDHAAMAIVWVRADGSYMYANKTFCDLVGYSEDEILNKKVWEVNPDFQQETWAKHWERIRGLGADALESHQRTKDGRVIPIDLTIKYLEYKGEEFHAAFVKDISERRQSEEERKKLETQLRRVQRLETIGTLAGGVAHDFNNILTPILGYSDMLLGYLEQDNPARSDIEQIAKAAARAKALVKQILMFSRQEEHEYTPTKLHTVFKEALKLLKASIPSTIKIEQHFNEEAGAVLCDPSQMHQILMNLCTNSAHAMSSDGGILEVTLDEVELETELVCRSANLNEGRYVCLTVSDTGCGMDQSTMERIFDPFFTTKKPGEGTGLGMAVVHGIVIAHGGGITVYSEPGKGTTMRVYLPCVVIEVNQPVSDERSSWKGSEQVLLVDDEEPIVEMGKEMLKRMGYRVTACSSSTEALELIRTAPDQYDVVITDQTMPHMTGDQLVGELLKIRPDLPIILITGFSERVTSQNYRKLGIRELVMKPLISRELGSAIRRAMSGARSSTELT
jgi:PAS domain S-box-containing protein